MAEPLIVPGQVARELDVERQVERLAEHPTCPHAETGRFADTGRRYIRCQPSGSHYVVRENPQAVVVFCCGDYTRCPVFEMVREGGDAIDQFRAEMEQRRQDRLTRAQIERGIRVDDRDVERDQAQVRADGEAGTA